VAKSLFSGITESFWGERNSKKVCTEGEETPQGAVFEGENSPKKLASIMNYKGEKKRADNTGFKRSEVLESIRKKGHVQALTKHLVCVKRASRGKRGRGGHRREKSGVEDIWRGKGG